MLSYKVYIGGIERRSILEVNVSGRLHTLDAVLFGLMIYILISIFVCYFHLCPILRKALHQYKVRVLLIAVIETFLLEFFTDLGMDGFDSGDIVQVLIITIIVVMALLMLVVGMFKRSVEAEKKLLDVRNDAVEQQYVELRRAYEQNRCLIHDEKHRMQYIEECLEHRDIERASAFLREYREKLQANARRAWTGLPTLDFIINMKSRRMEELAIAFRLSAEVDSVPFSDADLVVLLGNLFDNAMEAAQRCPMDQRSIELQMKSANAMFLLIMENTSASAPSQKKGRFLTSKAEKENHGWGIESIRHIVQKYGGEIDFSYDASKFRVWIMVGCTDGENPEMAFKETSAK